MIKRIKNLKLILIYLLIIFTFLGIWIIRNNKEAIYLEDLQGKRALLLGDENALGFYGADDILSWARIVENKTGLQIDNEATAGTAIGSGINSNLDDFALCKVVDWKPFEKYDICFIMFGNRDYIYQIELGEPDYLLKDTYYGALRYSILKIKEVNPKIEIIIISPPESSLLGENMVCETQSDYRRAMANVAKEYNLEYLDLNKSFADMSVFQENLGYLSKKGYEELGEYVAEVLANKIYDNYPEEIKLGINEMQDFETVFGVEVGDEVLLTGNDVINSKEVFELNHGQMLYLTLQYDSDNDEWLQLDFLSLDELEVVSYRVFKVEKGIDRVRRIKIKIPENIEKNSDYILRISSCYEETQRVVVNNVTLSGDGYCE